MTIVIKGRLSFKDDGSMICGGVFSKDRSKEIRLYWSQGTGVEIVFLELPSVIAKSFRFTDADFEGYLASLRNSDLSSVWQEIKLRISQFQSGNPPIYPTSEEDPLGIRKVKSEPSSSTENLSPHLQLDAEAIRNFNEKADVLLKELKVAPAIEDKIKNSFKPDIFPDVVLNEADLKDYIQSHADYLGNEDARYFHHENQIVGIEGLTYGKFDELASQIQKTYTFRNRISLNVLKNVIFSWLKHRYQSIVHGSLMPILLPVCETKIRSLEVWIPIAHTYVQSSFRIGRIELRPFTKEMIDNSEKYGAVNFPHLEEKQKEYFHEIRKNFQGLAAAVMKIDAEPDRASEIARQEVETTIALLRCYAPENLFPDVSSLMLPYGLQHLRTYRNFVVENELISLDQASTPENLRPWIITNELMKQIEQAGLNLSIRLLLKNKYSSFDEAVLQALLLYSRSSLMKEMHERLLYILTALESVLLRDPKEPISYCIRDRISFFLAQTSQERKNIAKIFTSTYSIRSKFIHHGRTVTDDEKKVLQSFMYHAYMFFTQLPGNTDHFKTKEEFISALDMMKYSGAFPRLHLRKSNLPEGWGL